MTTDPELLIHLYADGELSGEEARAFEEKMAADPGLAAQVAAVIAQTERLRAELPNPSAERLAGVMERASDRSGRGRSPFWRIAAALAFIAVGAAGGYGTAMILRADMPRVTADLERNAADAHQLYAAEVLHPVEVTAARRDHLDGWLSNRLGAEISAPDLSGLGLDLVGGRLLPFDGRGAAQFMYEAGDGARLTLYAATTRYPGQSAFRFRDEAGLMAVSWQEGVWRYALVGALGREDLARVARFVHGARL